MHIAHRWTTPTLDTNRCTTASFLSNPQVFVSIFTTRIVRSALELFAMEENDNHWHGQQEDRDQRSGGCTAQRQSAKHVINTHFTLHDTLQRHRQDLPTRNGPSPDRQVGLGAPFSFTKTMKWHPGPRFFLSVPQTVENTVEKLQIFLWCKKQILKKNALKKSIYWVFDQNFVFFRLPSIRTDSSNFTSSVTNREHQLLLQRHVQL